jgi:hypothetical protein
MSLDPSLSGSDGATTRSGSTSPTAEATVHLAVERTMRVVWWAIGVSIVATFGVQLWRRSAGLNTVINLFDSDQKLNFPTTLKILLMISASLLFVVVGLGAGRRRVRLRWIGMGAIFGLLTLDELTYMHQRLSDSLHHWAGTDGVLRFAWILIYVPIVAVVAVVYLPFWRGLVPRLRNGLLISALLFAGGSAGIELFKGALYDDEHWSLGFGLVAALSDSLELLGLGILVALLLREAAAAPRALHIRFDGSS